MADINSCGVKVSFNTSTKTYKRNFQVNCKFVRTSVLDFVYPWETDLPFLIKEFKDINWLPVNARFEQNVTTHISLNNKINWPRSIWMKCLPHMQNQN